MDSQDIDRETDLARRFWGYAGFTAPGLGMLPAAKVSGHRGRFMAAEALSFRYW